MCDLTRQSGLKLSVVNPEPTDLCHADMRAFRLGVETVPARRKRQAGESKDKLRSMPHPDVLRRFDDGPAPGECLWSGELKRQAPVIY